ncbi:RNA 2',3'-cyclic phosphodiesterase [Corallococcus sp. H22C18031201]|nr:RNA 2',3'-cyclic phosphodiesterase [Corallococcus sp. H22C18031201]
MRLFTAVTLGTDLEARATDAMRALRGRAPRARFVQPEGLHLTLLFLGEVPESSLDALREALEPVGVMHAPFTLSVGGGGFFGPPAHPRVLWADVRGDVAALKALQADVAQGLEPLGFKSEHAEYTAHLTLARARESRGDPALADCARSLVGSDWGHAHVDRFILFESRTGQYLPRLEVPLTA